MIIQCSQCSTKFRFDDALMREDGVWVRCSICQYEFFRNHPAASPGAEPIQARDVDAGAVVAGRETQKPQAQPDEKAEAEASIPDDEPETAPTEKRRSSNVLKILAAVLVLLLVLTGVGYVVFPEIGQQTIGEWSAYLPWVKKQAPPPSLAESIRIEAVKQRYIVNLFAGTVRVVEGVAVNESGHHAARLQLKAILADDAGKRLGEKQNYAGNVLSDTELTILTEEEINQRLANSQGSTTPNDRIMPGGRVPFMVVVAKEPPGVAKVFVDVAGVERLLQ